MGYNYETGRNSPNFTPGSKAVATFGLPSTFDSIVIHHWGDPATNPRFDSVVNWLCNPASGVSAHYVIEANRVACLVELYDIAWHAGSAYGNVSSLGLELNPRASEGDYQTAAEVIAELWRVYGVKTLLPHRHFASTACPGNWSLDKLRAMASDIYNGKSPVSPSKPSSDDSAKYHTVTSGETLTAIARRYGTTVKNIAQLNKISNVNLIQRGQKLRVS